MRLALVLFACLLSHVAWAQLFGGSSFKSGSYILTDKPGVRQPGQLKLQSGSKLAIKTTGNKTVKLTPAEVNAFWIGQQKYVVASNFHVKSGLGGTDIDKAFVQQLDSGQIMLMRYEYTVGAPIMMGAGGSMAYGGGSSNSAYLLRSRYDASATAVQAGTYSSGGKQFRETVRPFLASRPDLVKYLDEKRLTIENLPEAIHALNHNLAFNPPSALNLE